MNSGCTIYTIDEFRCWKVENLDDQRSDENKNEGGRVPGRFATCPYKYTNIRPT